MDQEPMAFGPVQMLSIAFDGNHFKGEILPELERLKNEGTIRIIDLVAVRKDSSGGVATITATDLEWEEATKYGAYVGRLIGLGAGGLEGAARGEVAGAAELADGHFFDSDDIFRLTEAVEDGTTIAIVLLEHRWALPLFAAVERADGFEVANDWVRPRDLVELGLRHGADQLGDPPR
jgi:uncharacterized membrane protein